MDPTDSAKDSAPSTDLPSAASPSNAQASDSSGAPRPGNGTPPAGGAAGFGRADRLGDRMVGAARWLALGLRRMAGGFTDWLVSIGWWKFVLLSILFLIFSEIAFSLFIPGGGGGNMTERGEIPVNVHVVPMTDGDMRIESADGKEKKSITIHQGPRDAKHAKAAEDDDDVLLQIDGDDKNPSVRIDRQGVRISADDEGQKAQVVIDHNGVHIEKEKAQTPPAGAMPAKPGDAKVPPPAKAGGKGASAPSDGNAGTGPSAEASAEAVEAARDQIESILQDQVDNKLEAFHREGREERENWLKTLAGLLIIVSIILKVVLGSKSRAESQARQASATAAQEGLKRQLAEAQLKMMQAQVEPHFLFNTLASVDYLIETDPARASRMQKNLIQYLRAALPQMREGTSSLGREIQQCRSYLEILKVRMDERLQFSINVPQGLQSAVFPPMMLLTLVENAIKHGLEPKPEGGSLSISAVISNGALQVAVADSGLGFGIAQRGGTGVGLANVRERLQALFGVDARLQIEANVDGGTIATLVVPYRVDPHAAAAGMGGKDAAPSPAAA